RPRPGCDATGCHRGRGCGQRGEWPARRLAWNQEIRSPHHGLGVVEIEGRRPPASTACGRSGRRVEPYAVGVIFQTALGDALERRLLYVYEAKVLAQTKHPFPVVRR